MSSPPAIDEIARDARWLAQAMDTNAGAARLVAMTPASYAQASFLDDRLLQGPHEAHVVAWSLITQAAGQITAPDPRWIFHIGHVGSTLVARLLGELPQVLAVREPRLLRDLVEAPQLAPTARRMFARTFEAQAAVVKATSFVSEIAPALIGATGSALFMTASPANYIATILSGENSVEELQALSQSRAQRMAARVPILSEIRHLADLAAMAWACEATALEAAAMDLPEASIHWLDFDRWLESLDLGPIAEALALPASAEALTALSSSPLLMRYSKALDHEFTPSLRAEIIADCGDHYRAEIGEALAMLRQAAASSPLLAQALDRHES